MKSGIQSFVIILSISGLLTACGQTSNISFNNEQKVITLSQELLEISGITEEDSTIMAVQDEAGIVYFLDNNDWSITARLEFGLSGDYEAITVRNNMIYVVDSRGIIYELEKNGNVLDVKNMFALNHPKIEYEGIWVDKNGRDAYLVGRKSPGKNSYGISGRYIYKFSFEERTEEAFLKIPADGIWARYAEMERKFPIKVRIGSELQFSELIRDKSSGEWLILCARPTLLIVLSSTGKLNKLIELDPEILPQPEAMTWTSTGELAIGSEGVLGNARVLVFPFEK